MKSYKLAIVGGLVVVLGILASASLFTVHQAEQAIVFQFGDPKRVIKEPGLNVKLPFVQNVITYEKRLLDVDPPAEEMILADQKRLVVDSYTRFRISDPLKFYQAVRSEGAARARLREVINSQLRQELGQVTLATVLSAERANIMTRVAEGVNAEARGIGAQVKDVRIRRADLPQSTSQAIYERMKSEREREAREFRAQGRELAQQIRARADRESTVILAEARRESQNIRGAGDAEATRVYAEAFSKDSEFFGFYRSLQSYRKSFNEGDTTMLVSPTSEFFRYFDDGLSGANFE